MAQSDLAQALQLASSGQSAEAVERVQGLAASGDREALYALGLWRLEGRHLPRDLNAARAFVQDAAAQGSMPAARTLSAFLAIGIGGEADWPAALALLDAWADRDPLALRQRNLISAMNLSAMGNPVEVAEAVPVSASPWIVQLPGFLTAAEIGFLADLAAQRFKPALVFNEREKRFVAHPYRDAHVAAFPLVFEWPFIHALNRRIAAASGTDVGQGESLQLLRYDPGQQYRRHLDAVPGLGNQRILTMLVAMNDDFEGGATCFPGAGLDWRGRAGDALLFRNADANGRPDQASLHAGAPVTSGMKLIASRWIRQRPPALGEAFGQHEVLSEDAGIVQ